MFPELRATMQYLYENRRQWNEMYLADIDTDTFKTPAEKGAERVGKVHQYAVTTAPSIALYVPIHGLCLPPYICGTNCPQGHMMILFCVK